MSDTISALRSCFIRYFPYHNFLKNIIIFRKNEIGGKFGRFEKTVKLFYKKKFYKIIIL